MNPDLIRCLQQAGTRLKQQFGQAQNIRIKDSRSSIVTDADLESDRFISTFLRSQCPDDNLLTEESGFENHGSHRTWIVDPLDGTSNFAAGIPWFGIMVALLEGTTPVAGAMYLPMEDTLYTATRGQGTRRNGQPLPPLSRERQLDQSLCGFGMDASADPAHVAHQAQTLARLTQHVRNIRATNSLVDFTLTLDGRLGACVNFHTMIWDIAAPSLLFQEAGGLMTSHSGQPINFSLGPDACQRSYAIAASTPSILDSLIPLLQPS